MCAMQMAHLSYVSMCSPLPHIAVHERAHINDNHAHAHTRHSAVLSSAKPPPPTAAPQLASVQQPARMSMARAAVEFAHADASCTGRLSASRQHASLWISFAQAPPTSCFGAWDCTGSPVKRLPVETLGLLRASASGGTQAASNEGTVLVLPEAAAAAASASPPATHSASRYVAH